MGNKLLWIRWGLWAVFSAGLWAGLAAQPGEALFRRLSSEDGLSGSVVTALCQDHRGFVWIGTHRGLDRYDAYAFRSYPLGEGGASPAGAGFVRALYEDPAGRLWAGTEAGELYRFRREADRFEAVAGGPGVPVLALQADSSGRLWMGTPAGLFPVDSSTGGWQVGPVWPGSAGRSVACLLASSTGLWAGTDQGLVRLTAGGLEAVAGWPGGSVHCLLETAAGQRWAGTSTGLYQQMPGQAWTPYRPPGAALPLQAEVNALAQDQAGNLWAGTFGQGLWRIAPGQGSLRRYTQQAGAGRGLTNDYIFCLLVDQADLLWAGTYGDGINLLDLVQVHFSHLRRDPDNEEGLIDNNVYAVTQDAAGYLWVGTEGGLCRLTPGTYQALNLGPEAGLPAPVVNALLAGPGGSLWAGTTGGLARWEPVGGGPRLVPVTAVTDQVLCLLPAPAGAVWVGTEAALCRLDSAGNLLGCWQAGDAAVQALVTSRSGLLWVGTEQGLYRLEGERLLPFAAPAGRPVNVLALHEDARGYLWVGTESQGLLRLDPGREHWRAFSTADGLPDDDVYSIQEEPESGHLWVSTNRGLCRLKREARGDAYALVAFQRDQQLPCEAFNIGAGYRSPDGTFYFGCNQGLTYFRREDVREARTPPPVVITDFQLFFEPVPLGPEGSSPLQKPISETRRLRLSPSENVLYFEFAALSYAQPSRNQYAYRMEPFNAAWVYSGDKRSATYTNLDPGTYTFRVKAADHHGVWNEAGTAIQIIIPPPWYRRPLFYVLLALLLALSVWGYIRRRTYQLEQNRQLLQEKVEARTREVSRQKEQLEATLEELKAAQAQLIEAEKMASLGQLTAGVAHEINNPITFVSGNVSPLRRDIEDLIRLLQAYETLITQRGGEPPDLGELKQQLDYPYLVEEIQNLLNGIEEGADRTARIVRGLRNFSRLDEDELKAADITQGLESTLLILSNRLKNRIAVEKDYADLPELLCFPGKLNQVFMNILTNAIQAVEALPEGQPRHIGVRTWRAEEWVAIRITDSGPGMSEEVRRKVFDPFFTTKDVGVGTGLGLSISFGIMELHGGRIQVESQPGAGAAFTIWLPYRPADKPLAS